MTNGHCDQSEHTVTWSQPDTHMRCASLSDKPFEGPTCLLKDQGDILYQNIIKYCKRCEDQVLLYSKAKYFSWGKITQLLLSLTRWEGGNC